MANRNKRVSAKRRATGHKNYGKGQMKQGAKEIVMTTVDQFTKGIPSYAVAFKKIVNGGQHYIKGRKIHH